MLQAKNIGFKLLLAVGTFVISTISVLSATPRITWQIHRFVDNDTVIRHTLDYCEPSASGKDIIWDYSNLKLSDKTNKIIYKQQEDSSWCIKERRTTRSYVNKNDTLWQISYETATMYMNYLVAESVLKYPMYYGDTLSSCFVAMGEHGKLMSISCQGHSHICADAVGCLLLPEKSYTDVIRLKQVQTIYQQAHDTMPLIRERYLWYSAGCRYPILESEQLLQRDSVLYQVSFYIPQDKLSDEDELLEETSIEQIFINASFLPNPVQDNLYIRYELTQEAYVGFSLHTPLGVLVHQRSAYLQSAGYHEYSIPMIGQMTGSYTLYIHVDDKVMQEVIVKH